MTTEVEAAKKRRRITLTAIGTVVTLIATVVGLIFLFAPDLKPDEPTPPTKLTLSGTIDDVTLVAGNPPKLAVSVHIKGFNKRRCQLRFTMYDRRTYKPLVGLDDELVADMTPESHDDRATTRFDLPVPTYRGQFGTRVRLLDDKGVELTTKEGPPVNTN